MGGCVLETPKRTKQTLIPVACGNANPTACQHRLPTPISLATARFRRGNYPRQPPRPDRINASVQPELAGRGVLLQSLRSELLSGPLAAVTHAIAELGSVGRTQLAVEYAYRQQSDGSVV
jgi:hypothetical protein